MIMTQNMKGLVTTIALTAASTSTNGQNVNVIRSDNNPSTTTLELKEEDAKGGGDNYHQHPQKHLSSQGVSVRRILMDNTSPLLPEDETSIEKSESIGILSNNKESITHDQNVEVLSVPQEDVEDLQAQAQGRRLDTSAFLSRCETTSGRNGTDAYVDCVDGYVRGTTQFCATACNGDCCTGDGACGYIQAGYLYNGFTGKGKSEESPFI